MRFLSPNPPLDSLRLTSSLRTNAMTGKQIAAALETVIHAMGFTGGRQRQPSCTKPRGVACGCVNCGGPHAANSRSCGYLRESRRLLAAPRPAATSSTSTAAPPHRSGEACEPRRLEAATDEALVGFQAAFAAERAALKEQLAAVHRQLQRLRDELRAIKKKPPVPAAAPAVRRPVWVDAATQTTAAPPPAAMQEVAPTETEDVPPGLPPSKVAAASKGAMAPPDSSQAEKPTKKEEAEHTIPHSEERAGRPEAHCRGTQGRASPVAEKPALTEARQSRSDVAGTTDAAPSSQSTAEPSSSETTTEPLLKVVAASASPESGLSSSHEQATRKEATTEELTSTEETTAEESI
ncbi:uncharacterized protein LOC126260275 [Schistocerca nitens]|uniref:uncharacterized protein LOC126260275 n=1 Tax=Schistocerca nitens TaxID=7011 RepID=UPI002118AE5D|nr:uncharacterized protein LOC126260275 [Schistocerca nitens]